MKFVTLLSILLVSLEVTIAWRSALYPANWQPGFSDAQGRFLHDFSYAGYHSNEVAIPYVNGPANVKVTDSPFNVDNTGNLPATSGVQQAIDYVIANGGGVVNFPAGTYSFELGHPEDISILNIASSNVVLRGAGKETTKFIINTFQMRLKSFIRVAPTDTTTIPWTFQNSAAIPITQAIPNVTKTIVTGPNAPFAVGDQIIIRANASAAWIASMNMTSQWTPDLLQGHFYSRTISAITNTAQSTQITVDVPIRYQVSLDWNPVVYKKAAAISEVGIEDLSISNVPCTLAGWGENDWQIPGTGAYTVHQSYLIDFQGAQNCWVRRVSTFAVSGNQNDAHILSNAIRIGWSRFITLRLLTLSNPQYKGSGINGWMVDIAGSDNYVDTVDTLNARRGFGLRELWTQGNVIYYSSTTTSTENSGPAARLSCCNLIDNHWVDTEAINLAPIDYGHGILELTTTQSVVWYVEGVNIPSPLPFAVDSRQVGWGYVIGTKGTLAGVKTIPVQFSGIDTTPEDFSEGISQAETLEPGSLFWAQWQLRTGSGIPSEITSPPADSSSGGLKKETILIITTVVLVVVAGICIIAAVVLCVMLKRRKNEEESPLVMQVKKGQETHVS